MSNSSSHLFVPDPPVIPTKTARRGALRRGSETVATFRLTHAERRLLGRVAKQRKCSVSDVIRDALRAAYVEGDEQT